MTKIVRHFLVAILVITSSAFATDRVCANSPTLLWPARGPVTQGFHDGHYAIDISVPVGTKIVSAANGTVTYAGWKNNGGGYVVEIDHGNGVKTAYAHLSYVVVATGQAVQMGQHIAGSGATGNVTGPHLHFGVQIGGQWVQPLPYLVTTLPDTAVSC